MPHLHLWLLGPWRAEIDGRPLDPLPTQLTRVLLARLVWDHPTPVDRVRLLWDLYPDVAVHRARPRLRTILYYLRKALPGLVLGEGETLGLLPELTVTHDLGRFAAFSAPDAGLADLRQAVEMVRGPFLGAAAEGWAAAQAQTFQERYVDLLRRVVTLAGAEGDPAAVLLAARRWAEAEPWDPDAHVALLRGLLALGDRGAAERHLALARSILLAELGSYPAQLDSLGRAITRLPQRPPIAQPPQAALPPPPIDLDAAPLIGRERELARLRGVWEGCRQGAGELLILEGPPGVGKSRLVAEVAAQARLRSDTLLLWSEANAITRLTTFAMLADALSRLAPAEEARLAAVCVRLDDPIWAILAGMIPGLAARLPQRARLELPSLALPGEIARRTLALQSLLAQLAQDGAVLWVLEDVHQADAETLSLLADGLHLPPRTLLLATRRPTPEPAVPAHMILAPLDESRMGELVQAFLGDPGGAQVTRTVWQQSGGVPLFVRQLLQHWQRTDQLRWQGQAGWAVAEGGQTPPLPMADLLLGQMAALPAEARDLADLLALLGRPAPEALLVRLLPAAEARWSGQLALLRAGLLRQTDDTLWFAHDWLADTLGRALAPSQRPGLHRRLMDALSGGDSTIQAERMDHAAGALAWADALSDGLAVAQHAFTAHNLPLLEQALAVIQAVLPQRAGHVTQAERWQYLSLREQFHALHGEADARLADLTALADLARNSGQEAWTLEVCMRWGRAERERGEVAEAAGWLHRALALARSLALPQREAEIRLQLASVLDDAGRVALALAHAQQSHALADALDDWALTLRCVAVLAYMQMRAGETGAAIRLLAPILADPRLAQQPSLAARIMRQNGILLMADRAWDEGLAWLRRSVAQARSAGDVQARLICQTSLLYELARFGHFGESLGLVPSTQDLARRLHARTQQAIVTQTLANIHYYRGELEAALPVAQDALVQAQALALPEPVAASLTRLAVTYLKLNRLDQARSAVDQALALVADMPHPTVIVAHVAAEVALAQGDRSLARQSARQAVAAVDRAGLTAAEAVEILWMAGQVLAQTDGSAAARPVRNQAHARLVEDLAALSSVAGRQAYLAARPAHAAAARWVAPLPRRLILLPLAHAPTGRPLHADEQAPVIWAVDGPDESPLSSVAGRRQRLLRLSASAVDQGGLATVEALADFLSVSTRTLLRDLHTLTAAGHPVPTRRQAKGGSG